MARQMTRQERLKHLYAMSFAKIYPMYVEKAEKKERTKQEVDAIIEWLTGYDEEGLQQVIDKGTDLEAFFKQAPRMNPNRTLITGSVCGVKVQEVQEKTMREIRYLDKLIDELAKGKKMEKILRKKSNTD